MTPALPRFPCPRAVAASPRTAALALLLVASVAAAAVSSPCYDALSLGGFHGLALSRGSVTGFGEGAAGQLDVPPATAGRTLAVAAGGFFSCALHTLPGSSVNTTTVSCWGGSGSGVVAVPPAVASDRGPRALAAGGYHACAALSSGSTVCWGANGAGQVSPLPAAVATSGASALALGAYHSCAIVGGAAVSVACWGRDDAGQVSGVPAALASGSGSSSSAALRLACGGYHCCAWAAGASGRNMACWGAAAAGQTAVPSLVAAASNVSAACAGGYFSCAVIGGATVCWGSNTRGETSVPPGARDGSVAAVACGWYGACALKLDGSFVCWGGDLGTTPSAAASSGQDVTIASADVSAGSSSGNVVVATGAVSTAAAAASGGVSITTGASSGSASSGPIVLQTGASAGGRGAISLLSSSVVVKASLQVGGSVALQGVTLTERELGALVALARSGGSVLPSVTATAAAATSGGTASAQVAAVASAASVAFSATSAFTVSSSVPLSGSPSGSATPSVSVSPTLSISGTPVVAASPSAAVVTVSSTPSFSGTPSSSASPSRSGTATGSVTPTVPSSTSVTPTATATTTPSQSVTVTISPSCAPGTAWAVTTFAGSGVPPYADGQGTAAVLNGPHSVALDSNGTLYVSDSYNHRIRIVTPGGLVSTLAGSGEPASTDGQSTTASFNNPGGVTVDAAGNVYVVELNGHRIRKISASGTVTTLAGSGSAAFADGQGAAASFSSPTRIVVDSATGLLYVADTNNHRIRVVSPSGAVTTLAGNGSIIFADGQGTAATFYKPRGIVLTASGDAIVADTDNHRIRVISPSGAVTTLAGSGASGGLNGQGTAATFVYPHAIAIDAAGNSYVAEVYGYRIRKITPGGLVTTLAGSGTLGYADGQGTAAVFNMPTGIAVNAAGVVYVAELANHRIRAVTPGGLVSTLAGKGCGACADGQGVAASFYNPDGLARDVNGTLYVADWGNYKVRKISPSGAVTTLAGSGMPLSATGSGATASFIYASGITVDVNGIVYVTDRTFIRKIARDGTVNSFVGGGGTGYADGQGGAAAFNYPIDVVVNTAGMLYVADMYNSRIRAVTPGGLVSTLAGSGSYAYADGQGAAAAFRYPTGVALDAAGNVYVADYADNRIRKVTPGGLVTTVAGNGVSGSVDGQGTAASFAEPWKLAVDGDGTVYVADQASQKIRAISPSGYVSTIAGSGARGYNNGVGLCASFNYPQAIVIDASGALLVTDQLNGVIRRLALPTSSPSPTASATPSGSGSVAASWSATSSSTPVPSSSGSVTPSFTPVPSSSGSVTPSFSQTPSQTATVSPSRSITATPSITPTLTKTASVSPTNLSSTPTPSKTPSVSPTNPSGTPTPTKTPSSTISSTPTSSTSVTPTLPPISVWTVAGGNGAFGFVDGTNITTTSFNLPVDIAFDTQLRQLVVADIYNKVMRSVAFTADRGVMTSLNVATIAGNGFSGYQDGAALTTAKLSMPAGVAILQDGASYLCADTSNSRVRLFDLATNMVSTYAGNGVSNVNAAFTTGPATSVPLGAPQGVVYDQANGIAYITSNNRIITVNGTTASQFAGDALDAAGSTDGATGATSSFTSVRQMALCLQTSTLYVVESTTCRIRAVSTVTGATTTVAGSSCAAVGVDAADARLALFSRIKALAFDVPGHVSPYYPTPRVLFIADGSAVRQLSLVPNGAGLLAVTTYAGSVATPGYVDGPLASALFSNVSGLALDPATGTLLVSESAHTVNRIRAIGPVVPPNAYISPSPSLPATRTPTATPTSTPTSSSTGSATASSTTTATGSPTLSATPSRSTTATQSLTASPSRVPSWSCTVFAGSGVATSTDGSGTAATFKYPAGLALGSGVLYVAEAYGGKIRKVTVPGATVTTLAGDGTVGGTDGQGTAASFAYPRGVAIDTVSGTLYVADTSGNRIRSVTGAGAVTVLAGSGSAGLTDATGIAAAFNAPEGVCFAGASVFVADTSNNAIRRVVVSSGAVTRIAGSGTAAATDGPLLSARFNRPAALVMDSSGTTLYVADTGNHLIRVVDLSSSTVSTLAGSGTINYNDGVGAAASFSYPSGIALGPNGMLYVTDRGYYLLRSVEIASKAVTTIVGNGALGITFAQTPYGIAVEASGTVLYATSQDGNVIHKCVLA